MSKALKNWQDKKDYLEEQLGIINDPHQRYTLRKQIEECEEEITRLSGENPMPSPNRPQPKEPSVGNATPSAEKTKIKILFLEASPDNLVKLKLDTEFRNIKEKIKASQYRDSFELIHQPALRINDLQSTLLENNPHIVHFSGHGSNAGEIILENSQGKSERVNPKALTELFEILSDNIHCVVLNACFSQPQAQAISQHINSVIGMSNSISDEAAIDFAWAFYQGLAYGRDLYTSFRLGCNQLSLNDNFDEKDTPQLLSKPGSDPKTIKLVNF